MFKIKQILLRDCKIKQWSNVPDKSNLLYFSPGATVHELLHDAKSPICPICGKLMAIDYSFKRQIFQYDDEVTIRRQYDCPDRSCSMPITMAERTFNYLTRQVSWEFIS